MNASLSNESGIFIGLDNTPQEVYDMTTAVLKTFINGYPLQYRKFVHLGWHDVRHTPLGFNGHWRIKPLTPAEKLAALRDKSRELIEELKTAHGWSDEQITELLNRE